MSTNRLQADPFPSVYIIPRQLCFHAHCLPYLLSQCLLPTESRVSGSSVQYQHTRLMVSCSGVQDVCYQWPFVWSSGRDSPVPQGPSCSLYYICFISSTNLFNSLPFPFPLKEDNELIRPRRHYLASRPKTQGISAVSYKA